MTITNLITTFMVQKAGRWAGRHWLLLFKAPNDPHLIAREGANALTCYNSTIRNNPQYKLVGIQDFSSRAEAEKTLFGIIEYRKCMEVVEEQAPLFAQLTDLGAQLTTAGKELSQDPPQQQ